MLRRLSNFVPGNLLPEHVHCDGELPSKAALPLFSRHFCCFYDLTVIVVVRVVVLVDFFVLFFERVLFDPVC